MWMNNPQCGHKEGENFEFFGEITIKASPPIYVPCVEICQNSILNNCNSPVAGSRSENIGKHGVQFVPKFSAGFRYNITFYLAILNWHF